MVNTMMFYHIFFRTGLRKWMVMGEVIYYANAVDPMHSLKETGTL